MKLKTDTFTYATDDTVRMRHLSDGSVQILSVDGRLILKDISKESMDRASVRGLEEDDDGLDTMRGFMIGVISSAVIWIGCVMLLRWLEA